MEDLNNAATEFLLKGVELPIEMTVDVDMTDTTKYCFIILGPSIILPDTPYVSKNLLT